MHSGSKESFDPLKTYKGQYNFHKIGGKATELHIFPNDVLTVAFEDMSKVVPIKYRKDVFWIYSAGVIDKWKRPVYIKWCYVPDRFKKDFFAEL